MKSWRILVRNTDNFDTRVQALACDRVCVNRKCLCSYRMSSRTDRSTSAYIAYINEDTDNRDANRPELDSDSDCFGGSTSSDSIPSSQVCADTPEKTQPLRYTPIKKRRECLVASCHKPPPQSIAAKAQSKRQLSPSIRLSPPAGTRRQDATSALIAIISAM